ncbi:hypothetical protein AAG906_015627 [Vitis piasezkii]
MIEPSSPLYLHPSDNPGATITTCVFNGENYDMWEKAVKNALRAKNKLGIIDGTCSLSCDAKDMWEDRKKDMLLEMLEGSSTRSEIVNLKQEGMTVAAYYAKIKGMWDELNQYIEIPSTLMTLHSDVRSSILALDPLPTLGKIYAMIENPNGQTNKSGSCTHCGKTGHDVTDCFQLKGYPDWWPTRRMGRGRGRGTNGSGNAEKLTGKNKIVEEWILDSGASMHMTGRRDLFDWLRKWETTCVGLRWNKKKQMKWDIRTSRNPIGVGKLRNGVYYYKPLQGEKVNAVKVEEKYELWHRRLGHPWIVF